MEDDPRRKIIESYVEAYNRFDVDGMLANAIPAIEFRDISDGEVTMQTSGIDELRRQAEESKLYFSERRQAITGIVFTENGAEVGIHFTGTLARDIPGGLKAGDKIDLAGKTIFEFRGDKIAGITDIS